MKASFRERAAAVEQQIADVDEALQHASTDGERARLTAVRGSLLRSLVWYRRRAGTRSDIRALGVSVGDEILTGERV